MSNRITAKEARKLVPEPPVYDDIEALYYLIKDAASKGRTSCSWPHDHVLRADIVGQLRLDGFEVSESMCWIRW